MDTTIYNYISGKKRRTYGVIAATKRSDNAIAIGWSICNKKDQFSKRLGKKIACNRSNKEEEFTNVNEWLTMSELESMVGITYSRIKHAIKDAGFLDRVDRYFKVPGAHIYIATYASTKKNICMQMQGCPGCNATKHIKELEV